MLVGYRSLKLVLVWGVELISGCFLSGFWWVWDGWLLCFLLFVGLVWVALGVCGCLVAGKMEKGRGFWSGDCWWRTRSIWWLVRWCSSEVSLENWRRSGKGEE
ncbi:hypothetical protein R3W88_031648 [Solanum pinnatisectum]|uniref:Transmembrane protein n=1 Tax=Solanum pinnatisectum TaxID=50273 RepID=A0AAV9LM03_9SOLN|nr:hypothetical protein R3W88_031648 [Solanum pinnatisectum]